VPFPSVDRVIYQNNPLISVVCQLRFPRILMINEKQPVEFQEKIRDKYPLFQVAVEQQQQFAMDIGAKDVPPIPRILQSETANNYRFSSLDGQWHVNLTSTFIALSTTNYERWEAFFEQLKEILLVLSEIYHPPFYERVGLRYVDAFTRSKLNLNNVDWTELIKPFALGFMANKNINNDVKNQNILVELDIGNSAIAQITAGKGFIGDANFGFPISNGEESFIVDSDMYMMRKDIHNLDSSLEYLHDYAERLIRSIITETLHKAMGPSKI